MTYKAKMMASVLALVVAAGAVSAQEAGKAPSKKGPKMPEFSQLDTNNDGKVTPEELQAFHAAKKAEMVKALDANGDGKITLDEMKAAAVAKAPEGKADRAAEKAEKRFKKLDSEGKGEISVETLLAPKEGGKGKGPHAKMFEKLDTDKDGALSAEEYAKAGEKHGRKGDKGGKGDKEGKGGKHEDRKGEGRKGDAKPEGEMPAETKAAE